MIIVGDGWDDFRLIKLADDGLIPNSELPVLVYRAVLSPTASAGSVQAHFAGHGWGRSWVNGIFGHHHYHSTAHEALGITKGRATVQLGGEDGEIAEIAQGDVVVLPAGIGHKCLEASGLQVVGAYPDGQVPDLCEASQDARAEALANLESVSLPDQDPVFGGSGRLHQAWRA